MTTAELQKNVDSHLGPSGDNGGFIITVAKEGMIWTDNETPRIQKCERICIHHIDRQRLVIGKLAGIT
jgi:hypothetical protein